MSRLSAAGACDLPFIWDSVSLQGTGGREGPPGAGTQGGCSRAVHPRHLHDARRGCRQVDAAGLQCACCCSTASLDAAGADAASLSLQAGPRLLKAVQTALGIDSQTQAPNKVSSAAGQRSTKEMLQAAEASAQAPPKGVAAAESPPTGEPARSKQQPSSKVAAAVPQKQFAASGDDYGDDFEELVEQTEAEKPAKTKLQKQTNVKRPKVVRL